MQKKDIKHQAVVFGSFSFPQTPEATVRLITTFVPMGFMPQTTSGIDPASGLPLQRMGFIKGTDTQIQLANDRIDIYSVLPTRPLDEFINEVVEIVGRLEGGSLRFGRVALVIDTGLEDMTPAQVSEIRSRVLPRSDAASIEWVARWVTPKVADGETFNVNIEAMTAEGMMILHSGRMVPMNGIKIMRDVSTSPLNVTQRFDMTSLPSMLRSIAAIVEAEASLFEV